MADDPLAEIRRLTPDDALGPGGAANLDKNIIIGKNILVDRENMPSEHMTSFDVINVKTTSKRRRVRPG